jgi:hypothetical protein
MEPLLSMYPNEAIVEAAVSAISQPVIPVATTQPTQTPVIDTVSKEGGTK